MLVAYSNKQGTCTASSKQTVSFFAHCLPLGVLPLTPQSQKEDMYMNGNQKEKLARIELRVKPKDKERIVKTAKQCGLSTSEYVVQRALGYTPKMAKPDAFYYFYEKLCELLNQELSNETETAALKLFDEIYSELIDCNRQSVADIRKEIFEWQQLDSGLSKTD